MIGLLVTCYTAGCISTLKHSTHILAFHILILIGLALSGYLNDS